jgi:hypothetical protein
VQALAALTYAWRIAMPPWMTDQSFAVRAWCAYLMA